MFEVNLESLQAIAQGIGAPMTEQTDVLTYGSLLVMYMSHEGMAYHEAFELVFGVGSYERLGKAVDEEVGK